MLVLLFLFAAAILFGIAIVMARINLLAAGLLALTLAFLVPPLAAAVH